MKPTARSIALSAGLLLLAGSSIAARPPGAMVVRRAPPRARVEVTSVCPGPSRVWVRGRWRWNGSAYAWSAGRWVRRPRPGAVWAEGRWCRRGGGWVWIEGRWR